jgi:hypothetical protein
MSITEKIRRLTVKQYAQEHGKTEKTVREWIHSKKIEAEKEPGGRDWIIIVRRTVVTI